MCRKLTHTLLCAALFSLFVVNTAQSAGQKAAQPPTVTQMTITGEIAMGQHNYVIRGKVPAEVFTILNADPKTLDVLVKSGKTVKLEVQIVSGDNVEIKMIDGKQYP